MKGFYEWAGGRKVGLGILGALLLTIMAFPLDADFGVYGGMILGCLGITSGAVAYEDTRRPKP